MKYTITIKTDSLPIANEIAGHSRRAHNVDATVTEEAVVMEIPVDAKDDSKANIDGFTEDQNAAIDTAYDNAEEKPTPIEDEF